MSINNIVTITLGLEHFGVSLEVTFNHTPRIPAVLSGYPGDCSPEEPEEFELTKLISCDGTDLSCLFRYNKIEDAIINEIQTGVEYVNS